MNKRKAPPAINEVTSLSQEKQSMPASGGQERLWYLSQIQEPAYTYNEQLEVRINGSIDIDFLERSLNTIIDRQQALRTVFTQTDKGKIRQVVIEPFSIEVPLIETGQQDTNKESLEKSISDISLKQGQFPFDLASGPLFRVCVLQLPNDTQILLLSYHHIILDGRALAILLKEINALYTAELQGVTPDFSELPTQWSDYAHWEQQWVCSEPFAQKLNYWKKQLQGMSPVLNLPADRPASNQGKFYGSWESVNLPKKLTEKLISTSWKQRVAPYVFILATYKVLLMRYSGQNDIAVGTLIANRTRPNTKNLLGFFTETAILRSDLPSTKTFHELLRELSSLSDDALHKYAIPFGKLLEALRLEGTIAPEANPLQATLVFESIPFNEQQLAGQTISHPAIRPMGVSKFDLTLSLDIVDDHLKGHFEYNTDLFDGPTIKRFSQHFQSLLESVLEDPDQVISEIPFLTKNESSKILLDWNDTETPYPRDRCIHALFERQVADTPDAVAVVFDDKQLTYNELDQKSDLLAHYLVEQGVGPEVRVGLCLERSFEMVIGILGILKAGGAYVPLDPNYPLNRIDYILEDSSPLLVLTQSNLSDDLSNLLGNNKSILLDNDWEKIQAVEQQSNVRKAQAHNLAYVIYTSGSTGKPKGVMVNHQNVVNTLHFLEQQYPVQKNDAYLLKTNYVFDVSLSELFGWFMGPGHLVILPPDAEKSPDSIVGHIEKHGITHLNFAPSMLRVFVEKARQNRSFISRCPLKYLMVAGEAFPKPLVKACVELFASTSVENIYGPTEASIYSAWYSCRQGEIDSEHTPIGKPIGNTQLYVVDQHLQPVPIGVSGELCIAGVGLARGYLNQPELTEKAFIDNPFNPGSKLYKTGDVVRYLPDGNIEYIGRVDHQVKVRGFRIELGEIENTLTAQEGIREAVVLAHSRDGSGGDHCLAAYLVHEQGLDIDHNQLRENLKTSLPDYMVPSFFIQLEALPLTPNGKVDRQTLPLPDTANLQTQEYVAPQTEVEKTLVNIWAEILNLPANKIGTTDNFFELGGHSLLATQLISRINRDLNVELKMRDLPRAITVQALAGAISEKINHKILAKSLLRRKPTTSNSNREEIVI